VPDRMRAARVPANPAPEPEDRLTSFEPGPPRARSWIAPANDVTLSDTGGPREYARRSALLHDGGSAVERSAIRADQALVRARCGPQGCSGCHRSLGGHRVRRVGQGGQTLGGDAGDEAAFLGVVGQLSGPRGESAVAELGLALVRGDPQGEGSVIAASLGAAGLIGQEGGRSARAGRMVSVSCSAMTGLPNTDSSMRGCR
jgi:hypothetical protein